MIDRGAYWLSGTSRILSAAGAVLCFGPLGGAFFTQRRRHRFALDYGTVAERVHHSMPLERGATSGLCRFCLLGGSKLAST
jgi:hypothetical protein